MKKIYYKDDFDFILRLRDCRGEYIGWPSYDWTAKLWTASKINAFVVSCVGGEVKNCYNDNGQIHVVADNHHLTPGVLQLEFTAELPDGIYPDGARRTVRPEELDLKLVSESCCCPGSFDAELTLPYIKGEKGDKGDKGDPMSWSEMSDEERNSLASDVAGKVAEILPEISNGGSAMTDDDIESLFGES